MVHPRWIHPATYFTLLSNPFVYFISHKRETSKQLSTESDRKGGGFSTFPVVEVIQAVEI